MTNLTASRQRPWARTLRIFLLAGLFLAPSAFAAADSCAPSFAALHDFQVGDVFQRSTGSSSSAGGAWPSTSETVKYSIVSKSQVGSTISYRITGLARKEEFRGGLYLPANIKTTYRTLTNETLELIDSTGHILNQCRDDLVALPNPYPSGLFSRVRVSDSIPLTPPQGQVSPAPRPLKRLGGDGNLYRMTDGRPVLVPAQEVRVEYVYAEGLGLVRFSLGYFETSSSESLIGFARGKDTLGLLLPDTHFQDPTAIGIGSPAGKGSRKAAEAALPYLLGVSQGLMVREGYDLRGRWFIPGR